MEEFMYWMVDRYPVIMVVISGLGVIVPVASFIANLTPTDTDNKIVAAVAQVVDWLALNFRVRK